MSAAPVRTLVVDDEPLARAGLRALLDEDPEVAVVAECANGREAVAAVRAHAPDLVLLDVQMPGLDGFGVVREVGADAMPVVVFATAFDQYALRAFEARALDYLLKPFTDERFRDVLARAKAQVRQRRAGALGARLAGELAALLAGGGAPAPAAPPPPPGPARVPVRLGTRTAFVRLDDVDWIEAADYYARLHVGGASHLLRETMDELEARLDPRRFVRVHRSAIVRVDRVRELRAVAAGRHEVVLRDGTRLPLSRSRRERVERALAGG
jgi:two-component system LytT family response regulator